MTYLSSLVNYYPKTSLILIKRNGFSTIRSLLNKHWFSDKTLKRNNFIWPNIIYNGLRVPHWVMPEDIKKWISMTEIERCTYCYFQQAQALRNLSKIAKYSIHYERLVNQPTDVASELISVLDAKFGSHSISIINSIHDNRIKVEDGFISQFPSDVINKINIYSAL